MEPGCCKAGGRRATEAPARGARRHTPPSAGKVLGHLSHATVRARARSGGCVWVGEHSAALSEDGPRALVRGVAGAGRISSPSWLRRCTPANHLGPIGCKGGGPTVRKGRRGSLARARPPSPNRPFRLWSRDAPSCDQSTDSERRGHRASRGERSRSGDGSLGAASWPARGLPAGVEGCATIRGFYSPRVWAPTAVPLLRALGPPTRRPLHGPPPPADPFSLTAFTAGGLLIWNAPSTLIWLSQSAVACLGHRQGGTPLPALPLLGIEWKRRERPPPSEAPGHGRLAATPAAVYVPIR